MASGKVLEYSSQSIDRDYLLPLQETAMKWLLIARIGLNVIKMT